MTPKQILKEESILLVVAQCIVREITKYNEDMREEKQRENMRNGDYEYVDNDIHFKPENIPELELLLLEHEDEQLFFVCFQNRRLFRDGGATADSRCVSDFDKLFFLDKNLLREQIFMKEPTAGSVMEREKCIDCVAGVISLATEKRSVLFVLSAQDRG